MKGMDINKLQGTTVDGRNLNEDKREPCCENIRKYADSIRKQIGIEEHVCITITPTFDRDMIRSYSPVHDSILDANPENGIYSFNVPMFPGLGEVIFPSIKVWLNIIDMMETIEMVESGEDTDGKENGTMTWTPRLRKMADRAFMETGLREEQRQEGWLYGLSEYTATVKCCICGVVAGKCGHTSAFIGKRAYKKSGKPFKSGNKVNTIRGETVNHRGKTRPAFIFHEDDSMVNQDMCTVEEPPPQAQQEEGD